MKLITLITIFTLFPATSWAQLEESWTFGAYQVESSHHPVGGRFYRILKDKQELHASSPGQFWILSPSEGKQAATRQPGVSDITGDGVPDLLVEEFPLNSQCCWSYSVFSLGPEFKQIARVTGFESPMKFEDINGDSVYEIVGEDWTFRSWLASAPIVLGLEDGEYRLAADHMRKPKPTAAELSAKAAEFGKAPKHVLYPIAADVYRYMLELVYSGNMDTALSFLDTVWPKEEPGKQDFVTKFTQQLEESPYWTELQALNAGQTTNNR